MMISKEAVIIKRKIKLLFYVCKTVNTFNGDVQKKSLFSWDNVLKVLV